VEPNISEVPAKAERSRNRAGMNFMVDLSMVRYLTSRYFFLR